MPAFVRLGFLVALTACSHARLATTPPVEVTSAPLPVSVSIPGGEYFPTNSVGILRVDVAQAMATPYIQPIRERLNATSIPPDTARSRQAAFEWQT